LFAARSVLKERDTVLDIGCGWGSFIGYAAERYRAECFGVTVSPVQVDYAKRRYAGVAAHPVLQDYRNYTGPKVDHLVSMGMFEHVGSKNYRTYFECARRYMKDDGLFLLHTIWENERYPTIDAWQDKYIFPNGDFAVGGARSPRLSRGCSSWKTSTILASSMTEPLWPGTTSSKSTEPRWASRHGERFCRMWEYYLLQSAGAFRCRHISVGQFVLSPHGVRDGYQSVR
jgi:cyclopropane-fatty-acyl-phospholipid synthase